ncbi:DHH family phosphoesterase [Halobaculum magnesiiphilum]|uniref:Phosphohydrolase n=1 Tax=Halobaculum magnesiiphilum TaxID=1017351 RepID=A0A8T8W917_9EURY|nr:phosphohydrolase [Halobaculum magnesiiphilum]QZP36327.1 phosphohydrolase [Halobaculum magnesiiphilum]
MDDELIESDTLPLDRKSRLPGTGFFYPDSLDEDRAEERAKEAVEGAEAVVITDSDADGLGCVALIREVYDAALDPAPFEERRRAKLDGTYEEEYGEEADDEVDDRAESSVALLPSGPHSFEEDLEYAAEYLEEGTDVFVCDICPDAFEYIAEDLRAIVRRADSVRWFDHHQWDEELAASVRELGIDLVVGESDEECSTDVTLRSLEYDFDERFTELAAVTRDHDLWLKEDDRSDDLADFAYWTGGEEYAAVVGAYGVDLPPVVVEYVEQRRVEKGLLIEKAVDRAVEHEVGEWSVGVTYGRCSQNEVADALREQGMDAAVIVKPSGSASIRGSEDFERCHEVAGQVNGGGHPKAAGCMPDIYDDMLDYGHHWTTEGATAKRVILRAFESLAEEETEAADTDAE